MRRTQEEEKVTPDNTDRKRESESRAGRGTKLGRAAGTWAVLGGVAVAMVVSVALGYFGGEWLDDKTGKHPLFTIIGFFLGAAAGFSQLFALVKRYEGNGKDAH